MSNEPTLPRSEFYALLDVFVQRLEKEMNEDIDKRFPGSNGREILRGRRGYHEIGYDDGNRFARIVNHANNGQTFVKYFVEKNTGIIFGAKSFKIYNPNHEYGTLTTLDEYDWGGYYAARKDGKPTLVPKALRR